VCRKELLVLPVGIALAETRGGRSWKASTAATRSSTTPSRRPSLVGGIMVVFGWLLGWVPGAFQDCGISGSWLYAGKLPVYAGRV